MSCFGGGEGVEKDGQRSVTTRWGKSLLSFSWGQAPKPPGSLRSKFLVFWSGERTASTAVASGASQRLGKEELTSLGTVFLGSTTSNAIMYLRMRRRRRLLCGLC
jgi:hypothetical protein